MGKRKRSKSKEYDYILRKMKKFEAKLQKYRRSSSVSSRSDEENRELEHYDEETGFTGEEIFDKENIHEDRSQSLLVEPNISCTKKNAMPDSAALPEKSVIVDDEQIAPDVSDTPREILELLGDDPAKEKKYGDIMHKDVATRWGYILRNGLPKDIQMELVKRYLIPENCPNMRAPILNLEIKAALPEINIKKDLYSQSKQNQLASSLSAMGEVMNWALETQNAVPPEIIKKLGDAGRMVSDSHYRESLSRRYAILNALNKNIRDTIKNTKIDENLFGSNLSEHIKSSKAINKTGSEMKPTYTRPIYKGPATVPPQRGALNSRGAPPRVTSATEPRSTPAHRRQPRDRRTEAPRGRRQTNYTRQPVKRR